ncbi:MAG: sulfotransferase family 2 domain-containing protein [Rhodobacter sp.]|nr:sulfotransferase family 2 domain-containing protein [Rhodobacter sp.]
MPSLTLPDRLIWFAHCPKAGGTSVEQFMVAHWGDAVGHLHWGWDLWWQRGGWRLADPPNSPQHLIWRDAEQHLARRPDAVFAVIRDPVDRMASEYRWQRGKRRGSRIGKALAKLPFSLWLRIMLAAAARFPHAFDNHFRCQADFVPDGAKLFRLEDGLDRIAPWLEAVTGAVCPADIPHSLPGEGRTEISPRDRALIARAFAPDYARFGYPRPDLPLAPGWDDRLARHLAPAIAFLDRHGRL